MLLSRILIAALFIVSGVGKIAAFGEAVVFVASAGLPFPALAIFLAILIEIGAGLLILLGWKTSWGAWALAGFTFLTALIFHMDFANQLQMVMFMKNLAIIGGLVYIAVFGAGKWSIDAQKTKPVADSPVQ